MYLEVTNPTTADSSVLSQDCSVLKHPNTPASHRLPFMAPEGSRTVPELLLTAPCSSSTAGAAWALGGLVLLTATQGSSLAFSLRGQKCPFCHRKEKLLYLSPD